MIEVLAGKFTRKKDLMMDFCTGICPKVKACAMLDQHTKIDRFNLEWKF